jgi:hypothetical protein
VASFDSSSWSFFDVLALDAAAGAHIAMALREALPAAAIHSTPASASSPDEELPHVLRCRAAVGGLTASETRKALEAAIAGIGRSEARLVFRDEASSAGRSAP